MRHTKGTMSKKTVDEYADELFDLFWTNAPEFMKLSKADREQIMNDYNKIAVLPKLEQLKNERRQT